MCKRLYKGLAVARNYINAGLAFIWIRLFIELWRMEKQLSVVSFLVITGVGGALGISISSSIEEGSNAVRTLTFLKKAWQCQAWL